MEILFIVAAIYALIGAGTFGGILSSGHVDDMPTWLAIVSSVIIGSFWPMVIGFKVAYMLIELDKMAARRLIQPSSTLPTSK